MLLSESVYTLNDSMLRGSVCIRVLQKNRNLEIQKALNGTKFLRVPGGCKQIFKKIRKYFTSYPSP